MTVPLELIVWTDHCDPSSDGVWWTPDQLDAIDGPAVIQSCGWVIKEEPTWLVIVSQRCAADGMTGQPTVIVKSCITSRVVLGEGTKRVETRHWSDH